MPSDLLTELRGVAALAALLLLPGLAVVRAPWTAVPFLSASFWVLAWWWLPSASSRRFFLLSMLAGFALLAALRLLKPMAAHRPSWPVALVLAAALLRLVPFALWPVAPGADMSRHSLSTLLMVWRDGMPSTYEPLLPIARFGADDPGFAGLAADAALLSGLPAHRAAFLVAVAAHGLLQLALFALLSRLADAPAAGLASVIGLGIAPIPQSLFTRGDNPPVLALALLAAAAALLARPSGRSPAVAAGAFLGAAVEVDPAMAATAALCLPLGALVVRPASGRLAVLDRFGVAFLVAFVTVAPSLPRLSASFPPRGRGLSDLVAARPMALLAILLSAWLALIADALVRRGGPSPRLAFVALLALAGWRIERGYFGAKASVMLGADDLEAMAWIRDHTQPGDVVCNDAGTSGVWLPALAGRGITAPQVPAFYADALDAGAAGRRPCAFTYVSSRSSSGPGHEAREAGEVFRTATVSILRNP